MSPENVRILLKSSSPKHVRKNIERIRDIAEMLGRGEEKREGKSLPSGQEGIPFPWKSQIGLPARYVIKKAACIRNDS